MINHDFMKKSADGFIMKKVHDEVFAVNAGTICQFISFSPLLFPLCCGKLSAVKTDICEI